MHKWHSKKYKMITERKLAAYIGTNKNEQVVV